MTLPTEPPGTEFGYNFFEELPTVKVGEIIVEGVKIKPNPNTFFKDVDLILPLKARSIKSLQAKDAKINNILQQLQVGGLPPNITSLRMAFSEERLWNPQVMNLNPS